MAIFQQKAVSLQTIVRGEGKGAKNDNSSNGGGPGLPRTSSVVRSNSLRSSSPPKVRKDYKPMLPVPETVECGGDSSPLPSSPGPTNYPPPGSYGPNMGHQQGYAPHLHQQRDIRDGRPAGPSAPGYPAPPPVHRNPQIRPGPAQGHPQMMHSSLQNGAQGGHGPPPHMIHHQQGHAPMQGHTPMQGIHHGTMHHPSHPTGTFHPAGAQEYRPPLPPPYQQGHPPNGANGAHPMKPPHLTLPPHTIPPGVGPHSTSSTSSQSHSPLPRSPTTPQPATNYRPPVQQMHQMNLNSPAAAPPPQSSAPSSSAAYGQQPSRHPSGVNNQQPPPAVALPPKISPQPRPPSSNAVNNNAASADQNQNTLNNCKTNAGNYRPILFSPQSVW